jgi:hypothetical protein
MKFVTAGVGLLLGAFGAGAQVSAQLVAFAGCLGACLVQCLPGVGADPLGLGLGGVRGGLGAGSILLGLPGGGLGGGCCLAGLVAVGVGGPDALAGLGDGLGDGEIALGLGGGHPHVSVGAGLPHRLVPLLLGGSGALTG